MVAVRRFGVLVRVIDDDDGVSYSLNSEEKVLCVMSCLRLLCVGDFCVLFYPYAYYCTHCVLSFWDVLDF